MTDELTPVLTTSMKRLGYMSMDNVVDEIIRAVLYMKGLYSFRL
jgi:hypothetical protein